MGTKRRGTARRKTSPGRTGSGGRFARSRLEKIPIPPVPAFLRSATRAPDKKRDPGHDPPPGPDRPGAISLDAISEEEADLLLGVTAPTASDSARPVPERAPEEFEPEEPQEQPKFY